MTSKYIPLPLETLYGLSFGLAFLIATSVSLFVAIYASIFMPPEYCSFNRILVDVLRLKTYKKTRISAGFETFLDFLEFQGGARGRT